MHLGYSRERCNYRRPDSCVVLLGGCCAHRCCVKSHSGDYRHRRQSDVMKYENKYYNNLRKASLKIILFFFKGLGDIKRSMFSHKRDYCCSISYLKCADDWCLKKRPIDIDAEEKKATCYVMWLLETKNNKSIKDGWRSPYPLHTGYSDRTCKASTRLEMHPTFKMCRTYAISLSLSWALCFPGALL